MLILKCDNMKINKKKLILLVIFLFSLALMYQTSYGKYIKRLDNNLEINMANWNILVNDESILNKTVFENEIVVYFPGNDYYKENVIAPGASGYFDVTIDPNNTEVAFQYNINIDINNSMEDLIISGYTINPLENTTILDITEDGITGNVLVDGDSVTLRIYVTWYDGLNENLNNADDTDISINNDTISCSVQVSFEQIISQPSD